MAKLTWHNPEACGLDDIMSKHPELQHWTRDMLDTAEGDILVVDHDTGIAYLGHLGEGSGCMETDVKEFLAS